MIYVVVALGLVVCVGAAILLRRHQDAEEYGLMEEVSEAPPLVIPVRANATVPVDPLPPEPVAAPPAPPEPVMPMMQRVTTPNGGTPHYQQRAREHSTAPFKPPTGYQPPTPGWSDAPTNSAGPDGVSGSDKVVHTIPVADGTLQFLPGRLEIIDGEKRGRDIRFVRTWGEVPEITFGRVTGPPYRHVQLKSQTVSRQHARLQYLDGRWHLINLSQTNPVIVNGEMLDPTRGQCVLRDGDQIEMGEVIFRFRER